MSTLCNPSIIAQGPGWIGEEVKGVWGAAQGWLYVGHLEQAVAGVEREGGVKAIQKNSS